MQRRAAAISAAVLLLVAAGAYVFIGFAEEPTVDVAGERLVVGETITEDGTTYTVAEISGSGADVEGVLEWTNESARETAEVENDSNVTFRGAPYRLTVIRNESGTPSSFRVVEIHNVSAFLMADPAVEDRVLRSGDEKFVRFTNGSTMRLERYLPPRANATFAEGEQFRYENETTTVAAVGNETVTLTWTAPATNELSATEGANVTLGETRYLAHFPDNSTLVLTQEFDAYAADRDRIAYYHERIDGLWGVSILGSLFAVLLVLFAYIPSRY